MPNQPGVPLRALWAWPLGFAAVGAVELATQTGRLGLGGSAWGLGIPAAAGLGLWPALLSVLVVGLVRSRWKPGSPRIMSETGRVRLAVALVIAVPLGLVAVWVVEPVYVAMENHPIDYQEVGISVGQTAAMVGAVLVPILIYPVARGLEGWLERPGVRGGAVRVSATVLALGLVVHLASGPFVLTFGLVTAPLLVVAAAAAAATWLPPWRVLSRVGVVANAVGVVALVVAGGFGWRHGPTRAALLHDTRVMPGVMRLGLGFLDGDGDGDMPVWLGGWDCDDGDPKVGAHRPEVPGNGLDDNCHGGDASVAQPSTPAPAPAGDGPRPSIVLVTLDAVRAHNLRSLGHVRDTMPNLEAFARGGRWYRQASAPSNQTFFSVLSLLSGQSPERLVVNADGQNVAFSFWLPHHLAKLGYRTVAIHPPLLGESLPFSQLRFQELSFGPWDFDGPNRGGTARQRVSEAQRLLTTHDGSAPLFLWLHLYDAHAYHEAHDRFPVGSPVDAYDNELFWIDIQLGRLFRTIEASLGSDALVIVTSDHGETFGERGAYGHGHGLHEIETHVPLLLRGFGIEAGVVDDPVSVGSVVPTVLDLLGHEPSSRISYPSLRASSGAGVLVEAPYTGDERRWDAAYREGRWKLSISRGRQTRVLFDLESDPSEWRDVAASHPEVVDRLESELWARLESAR